MKYCLSARQQDSLLKKADEIKIELRDFRALPDYIDKYLFCNYNAYINNTYTNNKDISNIDYFYKMNKMNDYVYSSEELDNFYMTFCNIILENTSFRSLQTEYFKL